MNLYPPPLGGTVNLVTKRTREKGISPTRILGTKDISWKYYFAESVINRLVNYKAALSAGKATVVVIGDSITEGFWATNLYDGYPGLFRDLMQVKYGSLGEGYMNHNGRADYGRFVYTGEWTPGDWTAETKEQMYLEVASAGATASVTTLPCTDITVIYDQMEDAGSFTVAIDGVAYTTSGTGTTYLGKRYKVTGLTNSAHTVVVSAVGKFYFRGLIAEITANTGVAVHQVGHNGNYPGLITDDAAADSYLRMLIDDFTPDLVVLAWGYNGGAISDANFKADVQAFIDRAIGVGADVLLLSTDGNGRETQLHELLVANIASQVGLMDMAKALWNPNEVTYEFFSDGTPGSVGANAHPSDAGHARMAQAMFSLLG